jgi:hypothetical protein
MADFNGSRQPAFLPGHNIAPDTGPGLPAVPVSHGRDEPVANGQVNVVKGKAFIGVLAHHPYTAMEDAMNELTLIAQPKNWLPALRDAA